MKVDRMRARGWIPLLVAGVLAVAGVSRANEAVLGLAGKQAPQFDASDPDGNPVSLSSLLDGGKGAVLINFWGLRCQACVQEIPHLNGLHRKYGSSGLKILGVNVDGLPGAKARALVSEMGIRMEYPWIPDPDFKVVDLYKMNGAPFNVLVDASGKVVYEHEGFEAGDEARIEAEVRKALSAVSASRR